MKNRICPIILAFFLLFSTTAYAASPRVAPVVPSITFNGTTAVCSVLVIADKSSDSIDATIKLWQGNQCIKTWTDSSTGDLDFSGKYGVSKGKTYELTVDVSISGKNLPRYSVQATCK